MLTIDGDRLIVKTLTQAAVFEAGRLVSLKAADGREHVRTPPHGPCPLQLIYASGERVGLLLHPLPPSRHRADRLARREADRRPQQR